MPDAPFHSISQDEKRRLRRESVDLVRVLVCSDTVNDGAKILADYRRKFGQCADHFLRYELPALFLSDLLSRCCRHQTRQVSYLLDEHLVDFGLMDIHRNLRQQELSMYRRFNDAEGESKCIRLLKAMTRGHE